MADSVRNQSSKRQRVDQTLADSARPMAMESDSDFASASELELLRQRNADLKIRNNDLRQLAEVGWQAELKLKKFHIIESDLADEVSELKAAYATQEGHLAAKETALAELKGAISAKQNEIETLKSERHLRALELTELSRVSRVSEESAKSSALMIADLKAAGIDKDRRINELSKQLAALEVEFVQAGERFQVELDNEAKRFQLLSSDLQEEISEIRVELSAANARFDGVAGQTKALQSELQKKSRELETVRAELSAAKEGVASASKTFHVQLSELGTESFDLELKVKRLRAVEASLSAELKAAQLEVKNQRLTLESTSKEVAKLTAYKAAAEAKFASLTTLLADAKAQLAAQAHTLSEEGDRQQASLEAMGAALQTRERELASVRATLAQQTERFELTSSASVASEIENRRLSEKLLMLSHENRRKEDAFESKQKELTAQATSFEKARQENLELRRKVDALTALRDEDSEKFEQQSRAFARLSESEVELKSKLSNLSRESQQLTLGLTEEREASAQMKAEIQDLRAQLDLANELSFEREQKISELTGLCASLESKTDQHTSRREAVLARRESQLRQYSAAINTEKSKVIACSKQLSEEIETAQKLNPLRDYLSLTEFELSRVELQLKKTPTSSVDRLKIENCLTQLVEQRDFLRSAIAESGTKLQKQAAELTKIIQSERLAPMPPPPPPTL